MFKASSRWHRRWTPGNWRVIRNMHVVSLGGGQSIEINLVSYLPGAEDRPEHFRLTMDPEKVREIRDRLSLFLETKK